MNVKQLIEVLKGLNPDAKVILASDAEGNAYRPMDASVEIDVFFIDDSILTSDDLEDSGYDPGKADEAVVFYPI